MSFDTIGNWLGEDLIGVVGGLIIGALFGLLAQKSRFCLRAATLEVAHGRLGDRLSIWLLVFSSALIATQSLIVLGLFNTGAVRQLNSQGSLSGAILGGLLFGAGMVLTRACASRMLILSATGNLRALLSGLVFVVVAQSARSGLIEPIRSAINGLWIMPPANRDLLGMTGVGHDGAIAFASLWLVGGLLLGWKTKVGPKAIWMALGTGLTVGLAWWFTFNQAAVSFDPVSVHSLSFTSPSSDVLMFVLSPPGTRLTFDIGLVPGVALGAFFGGLSGGELKLEGFEGGPGMRRYIAGGCLMGFGGVLAGGCAVGAGISGASIFAATSWIVLWSMWLGAVATDYAVDRKRSQPN